MNVAEPQPPPKSSARIDHLLIGAIGPLGDKRAPSGIDKHPVTRRLRLGREGFEGDFQGDRKNHGGRDKAAHHYPFEHYAAWRAEIGGLPRLDQPGAFGENFSARGLDEDSVALGDVFRVGSAVIEVAQGRQPCWKLNVRFSVPDMAMRVQKSGRTGWYYRVLEEGFVAPGDELRLIDRRSPDWPISRLWRALYVDAQNPNELAAMAALARLPEGWRRIAERRLATRTVEDASARLTGADRA
ncbi:MOSC domain containing protein [Methylocella silvestris BL2]|uniref:MOSC domain containing protein n=1 Tax=Methylocella silvestris (strain DSM 15510 / CIP 108128 / LMG 27833 / NCIMB 13906 / BL2) TaxID=395965 RepID=B8EJB1_METSB|nr:MOSC domain-containing protein [Methylocella silvestris]ACK52603.1 MOSC domain containing protein [Methylocella silvestris BL2]